MIVLIDRSLWDEPLASLVRAEVERRRLTAAGAGWLHCFVSVGGEDGIGWTDPLEAEEPKRLEDLLEDARTETRKCHAEQRFLHVLLLTPDVDEAAREFLLAAERPRVNPFPNPVVAPTLLLAGPIKDLERLKGMIKVPPQLPVMFIGNHDKVADISPETRRRAVLRLVHALMGTDGAFWQKAGLESLSEQVRSRRDGHEKDKVSKGLVAWGIDAWNLPDDGVGHLANDILRADFLRFVSGEIETGWRREDLREQAEILLRRLRTLGTPADTERETGRPFSDHPSTPPSAPFRSRLPLTREAAMLEGRDKLLSYRRGIRDYYDALQAELPGITEKVRARGEELLADAREELFKKAEKAPSLGHLALLPDHYFANIRPLPVAPADRHPCLPAGAPFWEWCQRRFHDEPSAVLEQNRIPARRTWWAAWAVFTGLSALAAYAVRKAADPGWLEWSPGVVALVQLVILLAWSWVQSRKTARLLQQHLEQAGADLRMFFASKVRWAVENSQRTLENGLEATARCAARRLGRLLDILVTGWKGLLDGREHEAGQVPEGLEEAVRDSVENLRKYILGLLRSGREPERGEAGQELDALLASLLGKAWSVKLAQSTPAAEEIAAVGTAITERARPAPMTVLRDDVLATHVTRCLVSPESYLDPWLDEKVLKAISSYRLRHDTSFFEAKGQILGPILLAWWQLDVGQAVSSLEER
jgi:hypothetical protein